MKKRTSKLLSLLLGVVLLLSVLPATVAAEDTTLYRWTASTEAKDSKTLAANLMSGAGVKVRWNETGTIYTAQGKQQVTLHTFLNESVKQGSKTYGLSSGTGRSVESLRVDSFPIVSTAGFEAVGLSFVYAYKPADAGLNPANSDLLRVYVSGDGMTWSEDYVGVRSAQMLGSGTTDKGEQIVCYRIYCEDLMKLAGNMIWGLRIVPDGESGMSRGTFGLSEINITGYKSKADFETAVPAKAAQAAGNVDPELCRQIILETARNSDANSELGMLQDAFSSVTSIASGDVSDLLYSTQFRPMDGIATEAADSVKALFGYMYERHTMTPEKEAQILAEYEAINTTDDIVRDLNTPQTILRAYGKAKAGEVLLQVNDDGTHAYVVVKSDPVYMVDQLNVDPLESTITYLTPGGEETKTFYDAYMRIGFLPLTAEVLASGTVFLPTVDMQFVVADGVRLTVVSDRMIRACEIVLGSAEITKENINTNTLICSDEALAAAVAALADGKHQMTVTVTDAFNNEHMHTIELEVKDGKTTVLGVAASDHDAVCPAKAMTDVDKNAWYHEAVDYALTNGIMAGYNATTFGTNDTLSRAMVVQVLYNKEGKPAISGKHNFTDVPANEWFNNAVTWGTSNGVMSGYGEGKFGPNDAVTVEQIAVILWNYSGNPAFTGKADSVGAHSGWAANALSWAVENGILDNVPYENVNVAGATRAQTAQMLMNYLKAN